MIENFGYDYYRASAEHIASRIGFVPDTGVVLGTGCSEFTRRIENPVSIPYAEIPNFPLTTNKAHPGILVAGALGRKRIVCLNGRFHYYEGYTFEELRFPVSVLKILGISKLIVTNASGAVNLDYRPGDLMLISDHIKLFEGSPLRGANVDELGPRFFGVCDMYSKRLRQIALQCAVPSRLRVREGVYMFFPGPQYETPAEIRAARILGADAVGMSTVTEALAAAHSKMELLGIALITNMASGIEDKDEDGSGVAEVAQSVSEDFCSYLESVIDRI